MSVSPLNIALPLCSSLLSFVFAAMVFSQWLQRRRAFQMVWTIGLVWYGISAGTEFLGSAFGWNSALYHVWYLIGAVFVPAYLGAGTLYLLSKTGFGYFVAASVVLGGLFSLLAIPKYPGSATAAYVTFGIACVAGAAIAATTALRREMQGHVAMAFLVAGSLIVGVVVLTAPVSSSYVDPSTHVPVGGAFPGYARVCSFPFNAGGGLAIVFGALYSAYIYMPKKRVVPANVPVIAVVVNFVASLPRAVSVLVASKLNSRVPATILIAIGASIPGLTSGLNRFGVTWSFFLGEFLGVLLIFLGFLVSEDVFKTLRFNLWLRRPSGSLEGEAG